MARGDVGTQEQRLDQALPGAAGGDLLVRPRHHRGQHEGGAHQGAREAVHFLDVVQGVAAHALRVALIFGVDLRSLHVFTVLAGHAEVAGGVLERVVAHVAHHRVVALDGVQGIDDLAAGQGVTAEALALGPQLERVGIFFDLTAGAAEGQAHAVPARTRRQEGEVEAHDVVVLDDVGVALDDDAHQLGDELALGSAVEEALEAVIVAQGGHKDRAALGREIGRLQVDLHAAHVVVGKALEVGAAAPDEVLLDLGADVDLAAHLAQGLDLQVGVAVTIAAHERLVHVGETADAHEQPVVVIALERLVAGQRVPRHRLAVLQGHEAVAERRQHVERARQEPGLVGIRLAQHLPIDAPPDGHAAIRAHVDGDDARGRVGAEDERLGVEAGARRRLRGSHSSLHLLRKRTMAAAPRALPGANVRVILPRRAPVTGPMLNTA